VTMGFVGTGVQSRGSFVCRRPEYSYGANGQIQVIIRAFGEGIRLHHTNKRRVFKSLRDDQIVTQIAGEYGLQPDVEQTTPVRDQLIQAAETDAQFILRLARKHGFFFNVTDGVLSFRKERFQSSGVTLRYRVGEDGSLARFNVLVDQQFMGGTVEGRLLNPVTLEEYHETSTDQEDALTAGGKSVGLSEKGLKLASEYASLDGSRPTIFMREESLTGDQAELRTMVEAWAQRLQWMVHGSGRCLANENLRAGTFVTLEGLGAHSGAYLVPWVKHEVDSAKKGKSGAYSMTFGVRRAWTGKPSSSAPDGVTG